MIIEKFSISVWFSLLFAVSFSGAVFGLYGASAAIAMLFIAGFLSMLTLWFAYQKRAQKNALKVPADALAILGLLFFAVAYFEYGLVVALIEMLFFLQLALNLYFREHRQIFFGLIACFVALMSGAIHTFRAGYLLYILMFCVFASFYLADCYIDKQLAIQSMRKSGVASHQIQTHAANTQVNHAGGRWSVSRRLVLISSICVLAGIIYLLIPRFPAGNLGSLPLQGWKQYDQDYFKDNLLGENADLKDKFYNTPDAKGGEKKNNQNSGQKNKQSDNNGADKDNTSQTQTNSPNSDDAKDNGDISTPSYLWDKSIYFYVKTDKTRYYQIQTKTYFDGASWYALQYAYKRIAHSLDKRTYQLYAVRPNATVDITVAKDIPTQIISTDNTVALGFPSHDVGKDYYDGLKTSRNLAKDTFYQLHVKDEYKNNRLIDRYQAKPDSKDLQLPAGLDPRVSQLAEEVVLGSQTKWDKALKLEQHMRTQYNYSLDSIKNQNNIPVSEFLFKHKKGHCEYFATSLALMLRTQGIPARMIIGFVGQDYNPITGFYEIKGINGHAWVAAYIDGAWVALEGTGAYQRPEENPSQPNQNNENKQAEQSKPFQNHVQNTHEELKDYLDNIAKQEERLDQPKSFMDYVRAFWQALLMMLDQFLQWLKLILPYLLLSFIPFILLYFIMKMPQSKQRLNTLKQAWKNWYALRKIKAYQPKAPKEDTLFYMQVIQGLLARYGIKRNVGEPITGFTQLLLAEKLINEQTAQQLSQHINQLFYSQAVENLVDETSSVLDHAAHEILSGKACKTFFVELYEDLQSQLT